MIGNDIIDLTYSRQKSNVHHPRWADKVLMSSEKEQLSLFSDLELPLWTFWALKESAYKIFFRKTGKRLFIPKKFLCSFLDVKPDQIEAKVSCDLGEWSGLVQIYPDSLHAVVVTQKEYFSKLNWRRIPMSQTAASWQSLEVREELKRAVSHYCQLPYQDLNIQRLREFPQIFFKNKALPIDVSMSHHYHWGAFAFLQVNT
jgi:phosphopantetheinyl transferase (holo-ACP synthase)